MNVTIQNLVHNALNQGLPAVTAASGAVLGAMRSNRLVSVLLYSGAGWLTGYVSQKILFRLMEGGPKQLPQPVSRPAMTLIPGGKEEAPVQSPNSAPSAPPSTSGSPGSSGNMSGSFGGE